jgi:hypothetical protein
MSSLSGAMASFLYDLDHARVALTERETLRRLRAQFPQATDEEIDCARSVVTIVVCYELAEAIRDIVRDADDWAALAPWTA